MRLSTFLIIPLLAVGIVELPRAHAQNLSVGVAAGANLNGDFRTVFVPNGIAPGIDFVQRSDAGILIGGAAVEWRFSGPLSLELDAVYRRLRGSDFTVVTWEFPVLAKYRFAFRGVRPFIEAGPSFRATGNLNGVNPSHYGITAGLGVEMHLRSWNIAPAVRYTRWAPDHSLDAQTIPNQVEFLVGFSRAPESNWRPLGRHLSLGVVAGSSLTGDFQSYSSAVHVVSVIPNPGGGFSLHESDGTLFQYSGPRSFIAGPMVELALPRGLSLEAEAVHRPLRAASLEVLADGTTSVFTGAITTWEFPVLAKYKFALRRVTPFAELGPSFRLPQEVNGAALSHYGATAGAGIEARWHALKIAPALRYTHWAADHARGGGAVLGLGSGVLRNQAELVVVFSF